MECRRCFRRCSLKEGKFGYCRVMDLETHELGQPRISSMSVGPIEAKGIYHFFPGSKVLTVGFYGCNLRCPFCINPEVSHGFASGPPMMEIDLVKKAKDEGCDGLAFSFSEPLLFAEFVWLAFHEAHKEGLFTALRTSAMVSPHYFENVMSATDALCIDIKGSPRVYEFCGAGGAALDDLYANIKRAGKSSNLEVSFIIRPGELDGDMLRIVKETTGLSNRTPVHLVSFLPSFKCNDEPAATKADMRRAKERASFRFLHVYDESTSYETRCCFCKALLVEREEGVVTYNSLKGNLCRCCGTELWNPCVTTIPAGTASSYLR